MPPEEVDAVQVGHIVTVRFDRENPENSVWVQSETRQPSFWKQLGRVALILGLVILVMSIGELLPFMGISGVVERIQKNLTLERDPNHG